MPCAIPTLATNLNHAWKGACSLPLHADEQPSSDQRWVTTIPQHHTQLRSLCRKLCSTLLRIQHTYARLSASARTGTSHGPNHSTGTKKQELLRQTRKGCSSQSVLLDAPCLASVFAHAPASAPGTWFASFHAVLEQYDPHNIQ